MSEEGVDTVVAHNEGQSADPSPEAAPSPQEAEIAHLKGLLAAAVARYREAVVAQAPDVPAELVSGDTVEAVDLSLKAGRELVARVREHLSAGETAVKVPAGAPSRRATDFAALSPFEKIAHGLAGKG